MSIVIFFTLTMFLVLSSGLIAMYGLSVPSIANQLTGPINCDINNLPQSTCQFPLYSPPTPSNVTVSSSKAAPFPACLLIFVTCFNGATSTITNTGNAIWNGLIQIAYAGSFISILTFIFFNKLVQGIFLVFGITQLMSSDFGIPFLSSIWLALLIFYVVYGITLIKPGGSS